MHAKFAIWLSSRYAAQSKTVATEIGILGVDVAGSRTQVAPVGSGTSWARPPAAIRCTCVEVAVGTVVVASTQELERPFINTVVVGGAGDFLSIPPKPFTKMPIASRGLIDWTF